MDKHDSSKRIPQQIGWILILAAAAFLSSCSLFPDAGVTSPDGHRIWVNFNTDWKYHPGDAEGADTAAFDDTAWEYVDLPHGTEFVTPEMPFAQTGIVWYRKHFTMPDSYEGRKLFIEFEAAMQAADVWVNGEKMIRHEGGYTPFTIDVSALAATAGAEHLLAVKLDSRSSPNWAPGQPIIDFQSYGGLYRDVRLIVTDRLHVTDAVVAGKPAGGGVFVTYPEVSSSAAVVRIQTNVLNENSESKTATLTSELLDTAGTPVGAVSSTEAIPTGEDTDFAQNIMVEQPNLWHPYTPYLYTLVTTVKDGDEVVDVIRTRIGIRRIEWTHAGGLLINGERFKGLGVNMHQQIYGLGNAVPNSSIYYDVKRIKDGGLNYIRGSHYPHDPAFYDACDELGILVLDSLTGWQFYSDTPAFNQNTFQELRDMIRRDRNHPSVMAWEASLNESNFTDAWAETADRIVHEEYPGDQAYSAAWKGDAADIFIGASQHNVRGTSDPRPIIISEYGDWDYGGGASTSRQSREAGDTAMLRAANNVQDGQNKNIALPWFTVDGYWDYADYGGFSLIRSGLVDFYRIPKYAYYFLQSQRDPAVVIPGVDSGPMVFIANQWTAASPTTVRVYSNCEQVTLSLNGTAVATQPPDAGTNLLHPPFNFPLGRYTPGTLEAICLIGGEQKAVFSRKTPEAAAAIRLMAESTILQADSSDARLVFIDIVDSNGTVVPTENGSVDLSLAGPGKIVGPTTVIMKGGQLAFWVRSTREAGIITVTASASGLTAAKLELASVTVPGMSPAPADRKK